MWFDRVQVVFHRVKVRRKAADVAKIKVEGPRMGYCNPRPGHQGTPLTGETTNLPTHSPLEGEECNTGRFLVPPYARNRRP